MENLRHLNFVEASRLLHQLMLNKHIQSTSQFHADAYRVRDFGDRKILYMQQYDGEGSWNWTMAPYGDKL